jgi:DNA-binding CsgD family transcriptional regulator
MGRSGADAALRELVARCYVGLDADTLRVDVADRLGAVVPVDALFFGCVDPATLLFTGMLTREIPRPLAARFLENELLEEDVNKFRSLTGRRSPVDWLDRVTGNERSVSTRYREIMAPAGMGDELRAALPAGGEYWGFLCLHREDGLSGFTEIDARRIARIAPHLGEGVRRALLIDTAPIDDAVDEPGVLIVTEQGALVATTEAGERWLWELSMPHQRNEVLPIAVQAVVGRLAAIDAGDMLDVPPMVRVRTRSGRWAVLHASHMTGLAGSGHTAVVVAPAKPAQIAPIILLAYGLTKREGEVAQLALQGKATKAIARALHISNHTVEDHLKSIFSKTGVASRGELTARVFADHYAH